MLAIRRRGRSSKHGRAGGYSPTKDDFDGTPPGSRTVNTEPLPGSLATVTSPDRHQSYETLDFVV
jgi:hypothetical protein